MQIRMEGRISHEGKEYGAYIDITEEEDIKRLGGYRELLQRSLSDTVKGLNELEETM